MAKVQNADYTLRRGKLNKQDNVIHRRRNGKEHVYSIVHPNTNPPSRAQKQHRALFGKVNALVNRAMTDPEQTAEWRVRMEEYNRSINPFEPPYPKRFTSLRQFIFAVVSTDIKEQEAARRKRRKINPAVSLPKEVKFRIKFFKELKTTELYEMLKVRFQVFYLEQACRYPDLDDIDYKAYHLALFRRGKVIAYARLYEQKGIWHIGRLLTTERGQGFGLYMIQRAIDEAKRLGAKSLTLHAQAQTVELYERFGFEAISDTFIEAGIPHVQMDLTL